ncbi:hypothetical protein GRI89_02950 [Altererythrobacter salegens]|uniref:DUF2214 domain-containing protein n=1 Tax=Croceibacterium salegens TaxID=1737568 RepID=A0A6I4SU73_9SPHN|nr:hypothetical protein [Croceibacterium salegens]MXO58500.1 hypothetical protein [Croceibacterium salegens]
MVEPLKDPVFDPVGIVTWAIDTGIFDIMYSQWGWPIVEIAHFTGLCLLVGTVGAFDLRMIGAVKGISLPGLHRLVPFGVVGFCLSVTSGLMFVTSAPDQYLYNPAFQIKMLLLAIAGANMALFYLTTTRGLRNLPADVMPPPAARVFAGVSLAAWFGVIACGRVITAFRPPAWEWCVWCS